MLSRNRPGPAPPPSPPVRASSSPLASEPHPAPNRLRIPFHSSNDGQSFIRLDDAASVAEAGGEEESWSIFDHPVSSISSVSATGTPPAIHEILGRRVNFDALSADASLYSMLRAWVQDDPTRQVPWYARVTKEEREERLCPQRGAVASQIGSPCHSTAQGIDGGGARGKKKRVNLPPPLPATAMTLLTDNSRLYPLSARPGGFPAPSSPITARSSTREQESEGACWRGQEGRRKRARNLEPNSSREEADVESSPRGVSGGFHSRASTGALLAVNSLQHVATETLLDVHVSYMQTVKREARARRRRQYGRYRERLALLGLCEGEGGRWRVVEEEGEGDGGW